MNALLVALSLALGIAVVFIAPAEGAAALLVCGALASSPASPASAAVRSSVLTAVTGTHSFAALGVYDVTGSASITSMQIPTDPCRLFTPNDPCRVLTIATVLRATNGVTTCSFTGATTQTVPVADSYSVDAVVVPGNPIVPGNPVVPGNPIFPADPLRVRYAVALDETGRVVGAQATVQSPVT
jgi:hypothetical protein